MRRSLKMLLAGCLAAVLMVAPAAGQERGRIVGRVVDAQTGAGVANVTVEVVGAGIGTLSGVDGATRSRRQPAR